MVIKLIFLLLLIIVGIITFIVAEVDFKESLSVRHKYRKELRYRALSMYGISATCFWTTVIAILFLILEQV